MVDLMIGKIYKITNLENRKLYIGKTKRSLNKRLSEHLRQKTNKHFDYAVKKYGRNKFQIKEIDRCYNLKELTKKEKYWINFLDVQNPNHGYNIKEGGDDGKLSLEARKRLCKLKSKEHAQNISRGLTGRKCSQEHIENNRKAQLNKKLSESTKNKMGLSRSGKKNHNFKEIDKDKLKDLIKKGFLKKQIASILNIHPNSVHKKIIEYWGQKGINGLKSARIYFTLG